TSHHLYGAYTHGLEIQSWGRDYSASRRRSKLDDSSSLWNSATISSTSASRTHSSTPTSRSLWNGTSTCGGETRVTDTREHAGQRPAAPPADPGPPASSQNAAGNTGRGPPPG